MKAKEYANQYRQDTVGMKKGDYLSQQSITAISKVLNGMTQEWKELSLKRGAGSMEALHSCWVEAETKWKAFCRLVPDFSDGGLKRWLLQTRPNLKETFDYFDTLELRTEDRRRKRH